MKPTRWKRQEYETPIQHGLLYKQKMHSSDKRRSKKDFNHPKFYTSNTTTGFEKLKCPFHHLDIDQHPLHLIFYSLPSMKGVFKVTFTNHPGKDPETLVPEGATRLSTITLATSESNIVPRVSMSTETEWHSILTCRKLPEVPRKHLKKRSLLYLQGKLKTKINEDRSSVKKFLIEILSGKLILLDRPFGQPSDATDIYASLGKLRKQASYKQA